MIGAEVVGGDINSALRFLKKAIGKDGVHREVKLRLAFPKPSLRRREKAAVAKKRRVESERKRQRYEERYARRKNSNPPSVRQRTLEALAAHPVE